MASPRPNQHKTASSVMAPGERVCMCRTRVIRAGGIPAVMARSSAAVSTHSRMDGRMGGCFERLFGECFASSAMRQMVSMSVVVRCCSLMPCYPLRAGFFRSTLFWPPAAGRWPLAAEGPMKHFWIVPFQEGCDRLLYYGKSYRYATDTRCNR